jgi:thiamine pyrophosphokinase
MHALIFLWQPDDAPVVDLPKHDLTIAADAGMRAATRHGHAVDVIVGDFDSVLPVEINASRVDASPPEKDQTDGDLAIDTAREHGATTITIVGSMRGRLDHALGVFTGLANEKLWDTLVRAHLDGKLVTVIRDLWVLKGTPGDLVSLVPMNGDAHGVRTEGLQYPLNEEMLPAGTSRGISNVFLENDATVSLTNGVLLAVQETGTNQRS